MMEPAVRTPRSLLSRTEYLTELMDAVLDSRVDHVRALLAGGRDPDAQNRTGLSALMLAVRCREARVVALLLDHVARIDLRDARGKTALMYAAQAGDLSILNTLLKRGACVDADDHEGRTALMYAVRCNDGAAVAALIGHGATIERTDHRGRTALMHAALSRTPLGVSSLIAGGVDVLAGLETFLRKRCLGLLDEPLARWAPCAVREAVLSRLPETVCVRQLPRTLAARARARGAWRRSLRAAAP